MISISYETMNPSFLHRFTETRNYDTGSTWRTRKAGAPGSVPAEREVLPQGRLRPRWAPAPDPRWCVCASGSAGALPPGWSAGCCCRTRRTHPWERGGRVGVRRTGADTWPLNTSQHPPRAWRLIQHQCSHAQHWQSAGRSAGESATISRLKHSPRSLSLKYSL